MPNVSHASLTKTTQDLMRLANHRTRLLRALHITLHCCKISCKDKEDLVNLALDGNSMEEFESKLQSLLGVNDGETKEV